MSSNLFFEGINITLSINSASSSSSSSPAAIYVNGTLTDPFIGVSCSRDITIACLRTMYNVSEYKPQATNINKIGITGYLGQNANKADLQSFYNLTLPAAVNSSFQTVLINGACTERDHHPPLAYTCFEAVLTACFCVVWSCMSGGENDQTPADAGPEADLDTQYGFGMSFPTPGTFYSTGGSPPFQADEHTTADSNEPYDDVRSISFFIPRVY